MKLLLFHLGSLRKAISFFLKPRRLRHQTGGRLTRTSLPLLLVLPFLIFVVYVFHRNVRPVHAHSGPTACCNQTDVPAPREIDFPYYSLRDGFTSVMHLVNVTPTAVDLTIAIHALSGQTILAPVLTVHGLEKRSVDLAALLTQLSADVTGAFAEGSISIYFTGTMMPIAGQLTMTNPIQRMSFETEMVDNSPGLFLLPKQLNGLWWGLGGGRDARIMVTNTSGASASTDVYLDFQGERHASAPLTFAPHETKVLSITQLLGDLQVSPAQAPEGGITIMPRDAIPTLLAQGHITDPITGFSTTLNFPDPSLELSNAVHAAGVPIGTPTADSPYAGAGTFVPHVLVRNLLGAAQNVTISLEYPQPPAGATAASTQVGMPAALPGDANNHPEWGAGVGATVGRVTLASLPVDAYSTVDYPLAGNLPAAVPFTSIRIQYSGPPGSAIAEVASIEAKGDLVVDGRVENEGNGWASSGGHPWHLDAQTESILFLTNESDQNARIGFRVDVLGNSYFLTKLVLSPHETRTISIRKLRDAQTSDFKGNHIPASASDGSVAWIRLDNVPVMGRLVVLRRNQGLVSSYQCQICPCCASYLGLSVSPSSNSVGVNSTCNFYATGYFGGCWSPYYSDLTGAASWSSSNTNVATVSRGLVTGVAAGTANIWASYTGVTYIYFAPYCEVSGMPTYQSSGSASVGDNTPVINSISPSAWVSGYTYSNGTITGQYFGTNPTVQLSDNSITFSYTPVSDGQINYSASIPATTPTEAITITVTSQGYGGSGFMPIPGQNNSPSKNKPVGNTAPYPTSFKEAGWGKVGCCTLEFTYTWGSSTGNKADLSACTMGEYVTSSLGTGTVNWPYPMVEQATYPITTLGWVATDGFDNDDHLPPTSFNTPYQAASFTDTQIYRYHCPGVNNGNWVTLAGPFSIVRSVSQTSGVWQYKVTKADGSVTWNLP